MPLCHLTLLAPAVYERSMPVKAVIMAGGEGTRLRPITINRPKPMVAVWIGKPSTTSLSY